MTRSTYILLCVVLLSSCSNWGKKKEIIPVTPVPGVEDNRRRIINAPAAPDNNLPVIDKNDPDACDTMRAKGGQDQVIGFSINHKELEKLDSKTRLKMASTASDFQYYYEIISHDFSTTPIGFITTNACYVSLYDTVFHTSKDGYGIILVNANGTYQIAPGVRTTDEWKHMIEKFFKKKQNATQIY